MNQKTFNKPEIPNAKTIKVLEAAKYEIAAGDYYRFENNKEALEFLKKKLR